MRKGWFVFERGAWVALCFWAVPAAYGEEEVKLASSIFAADGRIPSIEEMLPVHSRQGLVQTEWMRRNLEASRERVTGMSLQGYMSRDVDESFAATYRRLEERRDLFEPRPSDNRFVRATDAIFTPAPIRFGGTQISFTPVTAWKKRNPLCLLNPLVFNISF